MCVCYVCRYGSSRNTCSDLLHNTSYSNLFLRALYHIIPVYMVCMYLQLYKNEFKFSMKVLLNYARKIQLAVMSKKSKLGLTT